MSIASRTTSIIGHIEDDYNALERLGADLTNVDKNIENIASVVNDIYDKLPKVTGTGSDVNLTPTLKGALGIIPKGNIGKNLINRTTCLENTGLTWTDGISIALSNTLTSDFFEVEINQNYTNNYISAIFFYDTNKDYLGAYQAVGIIGKNGSNFRGNTFTVPNNNDIKYVRISFRGDWNDNINILTANVQTEKGSTATSYESYREVTGDNNVVVCNKNIFDGTIEQGGINTDTGANQSSYSYIRCNYVKVIGGETISVKYKNDLVERGQVVIYEYDKDKNYLGFQNGNAKYYTRTLLSNTTYIRLRLEGENPAQTSSFSEIQVEYSNTPTSYVAHQEQSYPLSLGNISLTLGDSIIENNIVKANGTQIPITNTTLLDQLANLDNAKSYDNVTNVLTTSDSNNAQMLAQVSALKGE